MPRFPSRFQILPHPFWFQTALLVFGVVSALGAPPARPGVLRLNVETAMQMALARNFTIQVAGFQPRIAAVGVRIEEARFDPVFDITASRKEDTQRNTFGYLAGNRFRLENRGVKRVDELSSGLTGVTAWGTEYDLGTATSNEAGTESFFNDTYRTTSGLKLTQPLLRDAGPTANLTDLRIARNNRKVSEWQLRQSILDELQTVNFVYNELHSAMEGREVARRSRELARQLYQDNQQRVTIGVKSPLDVTEASAQVAAREEGVILAERNVLDNENLLKQLLTTDLLPLLEVRVEIEPPPSPAFVPDVRGGIRDALALRPDYRQAILELEQRHIRLAFQKNQLLPRLDLTGSLALLGIDDEFSGSAGRVAKRDQTAWSAGIIFSIPLGNRAARGEVDVARLEVAKALLALQQLEQKIIVDVDNASGQIVTARQRITSTGEARRLARETLEAGQDRLRAGTGTTFEVLDLQEKLATAEAAEIRARADYNKAIGDYHHDTGTSLREHHVTLN